MSDQTVVANLQTLPNSHSVTTFITCHVLVHRKYTKNNAKINKHCPVVICVRPDKVELVVSWWAGSTYLLLLCVYKMYKNYNMLRS